MHALLLNAFRATNSTNLLDPTQFHIPDNHCSHGGVVLQDETVQDETVCRPGDSLATLNDCFVALNAFMQIS